MVGELNDPLAGLKSFFAPGDASDPRVNLQLRQKIALALMARQQRFPKTLGEGLTAIGDALGERRLQSELAQADIAAQGVQPPGTAGATGITGTTGTTGAQPTASTSYGGDGDTTPPAVAAINRAITPATDSGASEGGYNSVDAAANAPQPGAAGTTPAQFANVRFNNPGAAYPGRDATAYGSTGSDTIGGGNRVANFPSPVHGAAANLSLLSRAYTGMPIGAAVNKWSGGSRSDVPGFDPNTVLTPGMLNDPKTAIPLMQGITSGEAPGKYPMSPDQWQMAHQWFTQGGPPPGEGGGRDAIAAAQLPRPPAPAEPDQALALAAPAAAPNIPAAPPAAPIRQAPPPQRMAQAEPQQQYPAGYIPPEPGTPQGAPVIGPGRREMELSNWVAAETARGNPYAAAKVALEMQTLQNARAQRQAEANKLFEAQVARGTTQANKRLEAQTGQAAAIQNWKEGQQKLITGAPSSGVLGGGDGASTFVQGSTASTPRNFDPNLLGTKDSPQRTGIPTPEPIQPGVTPAAHAADQQTKMSAINSAVDKATQALPQSLELINLARKHPGRGWGLGGTGAYLRESPWAGDAYAFGAINKQLTSKNFMAGYQDLRGAGAIGVKEGEKAEAAQGSVDPNLKQEHYDAALQRLEDTLRGNVEAAQRKANRPVTAWQNSPNDPPAPDINQPGVRNGKAVVYIGGDPKKDESYREVGR